MTTMIVQMKMHFEVAIVLLLEASALVRNGNLTAINRWKLMAVMVKMLLYMLEYWLHSRNVHSPLGVIGQNDSSILKGRKIMARKSANSRLNM